MKYDHQVIALLVAELRRFSEAVLGGPHDRAADVLLDLYDEIDRREKLLEEYRQLYLLKARENDRYRRLLNTKHLPLLRNTVDADMDELVLLHNRARQKASWAWKLQPLVPDDRLTAYAQAHANLMASEDALRHSRVGSILKLGYTSAGENIAWGQKTPDSVMDSWLWSPGHRRNIMSTRFTHIGCGARKDSRGRLYWCVCFGRA